MSKERWRLSFVIGRLVIGVMAISFVCPFTIIGHAQEPVRIILDTDIGYDVDDALTLSIIHTLADRGELELLAVTSSNGSPTTVAYIEMLNTYAGRPHIPIGVAENAANVSDGTYMLPVLRQMQNAAPNSDVPHSIELRSDTTNTKTQSAVTVLRQTLTQESDRSVVILMTGFATNLVPLLDSPADNISPLSGVELVRRKVRFLFVVAGAFSEEYQHLKENNLWCDLSAGRRLTAEWPTPILWSGYEIGKQLVLGPEFFEQRPNPQSPIYLSYRAYGYDRLALWDLVPPLKLVYAEQIFTQSEPGRVTVRDDGTCYFTPIADGRDRVILRQTPEQNARTLDLLRELLSVSISESTVSE